MSIKEVELLEKKFLSDSSPEEISLIKSRVYRHTEIKSLIIYEQVPYPTKFSYIIINEEVKRLMQEYPGFNNPYYILGDETHAKTRVDSEGRAYLREYMKDLPGLKHIAVVTGKNIILNYLAKFITGSNPQYSISFHKQLDEALKHISLKIIADNVQSSKEN